MSANFEQTISSQFVGVSMTGILPPTTGKYIYVHSSGSATSVGLNSKIPVVTTIDAAIGKCRSNKGDVVVVMPGHTETISSATALAFDVAGVTIFGLGQGSARPTITFDTADTTTIAVSAANVTVKNIVFSANFADIAAVFTTTTAKYFTVENCYFKATATNMNFLTVVDTNTTTADTDGLRMIGNKWIEPDTATLHLVKMDGTNADVVIAHNYVNLGVNNNKAALISLATGKIVTSLQMYKNIVYRLNTDTATGAILLHTDGTTLTGVVSENFAQHADTAAELLITASSGLGVFNNYASGVAGASGYILPAVDS